jgi:hypothetical protein
VPLVAAAVQRKRREPARADGFLGVGEEGLFLRRGEGEWAGEADVQGLGGGEGGGEEGCYFGFFFFFAFLLFGLGGVLGLVVVVVVLLLEGGDQLREEGVDGWWGVPLDVDVAGPGAGGVRGEAGAALVQGWVVVGGGAHGGGVEVVEGGWEGG